MLSALADHHVKQPIVIGLRLHGMDVVTAMERQWDALADESLLEAATQEGRMLLTNDQDFLKIDGQWRLAGRSHCGIVFWPQSRRTIGEVVRSIVVFASTVNPNDCANRVEFV
jgi:hypothetical protein